MMFTRASVLSFALSCAVNGLDLDVNNQDSIKSTAKTLASGIVSAYNASVSNSSIPGLFDNYYFWQSGVVLGGLIEYSYLTGDKQYDALVSEGMQFQSSELNNFMPPNQTTTLGNDDQTSWALAAMTAAEVGFPKPEDGNWIDYAKNVFDNQVLRYEVDERSWGTCGGGLRWQILSFNAGWDYKNTASNGNFFLLAARLARFTGNQTYSAWADKTFSWAQEIGLISDDYYVYDGAGTRQNCTQINFVQWSQNLGIMTEGAAIMFNITGAQNWTEIVTGFVNSSSIFQENNVLVEITCEHWGHCNTDQRAMKGIAARSFARAALFAPFAADSITNMLETSANAAAESCEGADDVRCPLNWTDVRAGWESAGASDGNLGEVFNALEVVQGLLYPFATGLKRANGTGVGGGNSTQNGGVSGAVGAELPESTGGAGTVAVSVMAAFGVAFAAALSC